MLNFLRKLRRTEMKTGRYLKYALGEIILVVIGILIALQINTWNLKRIARIEEKQLLENLSLDFHNVEVELNNIQEIRENTLDAIKEIYKIIETQEFPDEATFYEILMRAVLLVSTNSPTGSLDMLTNSGKINSITDTELRKLLMSWPAAFEDMIEEEQYLINMNMRSVNNDIVANISLSKTFQRLEYRDYPFNEIPDGTNKTDLEAYLNDPSIENEFAYRMLYQIVSKSETERLLSMVDQILTNIESQLENW